MNLSDFLSNNNLTSTEKRNSLCSIFLELNNSCKYIFSDDEIDLLLIELQNFLLTIKSYEKYDYFGPDGMNIEI